ncbi:phage tail tube protein, partial [Eikenella corrodens]
RAFLWRLDMGSKYMLAEGTTLQMSKEEVKDTSGNIATGATPVTYVDLADTTKTIDYSGESTDEVDVTTLASEGFKETALGLTDPGEFSFTGHYVPSDNGQKEIVKAAEDKKLRLFKVKFPDNTVFLVMGRVKTNKWNVSGVADVVSRDVTIRLSGKPKLTVG